MYLPLGVNLLKAWDVPRIQPDKRVAPSASEEARKIKRGITKRHLESLCRYEEDLFHRVDRGSVEAIYNISGLPVPVEAKEEDKKGKNKDTATGTGTLRKHDADYKTIQSARSRFHPVKTVREQAAANLVLVEKQEIEEWRKVAANWETTTAYCDIMDPEESYLSGWTEDSSNGNSDTDSEWWDSEDDEVEEDDDEQDEHAQWEDSFSSGDETEGQQISSTEHHGAENFRHSDCAACDLLVGLPTSAPSEMSHPTLAHSFAKAELISDTVCSNTDQESPSEEPPHRKPPLATEELAMVLNDKMILNVYLSKVEEGIKEARKTKAEKNADREKARQYYAGPTERPGQLQGWDRLREREEGQGPIVGEKPLRWFEYENLHIYNELSGKWELTVERRGRNYRLTRASDTETLDCTKEEMKTLGVGNQDWLTDTVPEWVGATGSGWFDKV